MLPTVYKPSLPTTMTTITSPSFLALPMELRTQILSELPFSQLLSFLHSPVCLTILSDVHAVLQMRAFQVSVLARIQSQVMKSHEYAVRCYVETYTFHTGSGARGDAGGNFKRECDSQVKIMMALISLMKWIGKVRRILSSTVNSRLAKPIDAGIDEEGSISRKPLAKQSPVLSTGQILSDARDTPVTVVSVAHTASGNKVGGKKRRRSMGASATAATFGMRLTLDRDWGCRCRNYSDQIMSKSPAICAQETSLEVSTSSSLSPVDRCAVTESAVLDKVFDEHGDRAIVEGCRANSPVGIVLDDQVHDPSSQNRDSLIKELVSRCYCAARFCSDGPEGQYSGGSGCLWTDDIKKILYPSTRHSFLNV